MAYANVEAQAKAVWTATTLEAKQEAFKQLLAASRCTAVKKAEYLANLTKWTLKKLDQSAANFMLYDSDPVLK